MKTPKGPNQDSAYLSMDLHDPVIIEELGLAGNKAEIANRKALQRIYRLIPDEEIAAIIIKGQFDSAHKITSISKQKFIRRIGKALDAETAAQVYDKAEQCTNSVMKLWGTVNHLSAPHFKALRANAISPEVNTYFEKVPGYQDIFENLNYCDCSACKSIFGPAAYFVDMLRLVNKFVLPKNPATPLMGFDQRRPDLKQIPLTCQKTNETVPYVQIVNERLRTALALQEGLVDDQLDEKLSERIYPFELPFHLPLAKIRNGLSRLGTSYSEVLSLLGGADVFIVAEKIGLSIPEWLLVRKGIKDVSASYGVTSTTELNDLETFCQKTGRSIHQVEDLFNQNLSENELAAKLNAKFFINKDLISNVPTIVGGEIKNLSDKVLIRINSFLRLTNKLNWSFTDLNWAIFSTNKDAGNLDSETLSALADIKVISNTYKLSIQDICAFLFDLKTFGHGAGSISEAPFDQVFNTSGSTIIHPKYAGNTLYQGLDPNTKKLVEWDYRNQDGSSFYTSWIAAGVGLREADLTTLVAHLQANTGIDKGTFTISVENLSSVYRHARLSQLLNLKIEDYLIFLKLFGYDEKVTFTTKELGELLETNNILKRSGLNVSQLNYCICGESDHSIQPDAHDGFLEKWFASLKKLIGILGEILAPAAERIFLTQLSTFLNTDKATLESLLEVLGHKVDLDLINIFIAADKTASKAIISNLKRWLVLSKALRLTTKDLASIAGYKANYFKSGAPNGFPTVGEVLELFLFKEAQKILKDRGEDLLAYMETSSDQVKVLSGFFQLFNKNNIGLLLSKTKDLSRIKALRKIIDSSTLSSKTGAEIVFLIHLAKITEWKDFVPAADKVLTLVRARHRAEDWPEIKEQIDGEIGEKVRKALLATALVELPKIKGLEGINTSRSLYEYLLIDVEMGDCSRISYIKEGLNAVQLYLHRCREQLEPVKQLTIPEEWWEWILSYRVWEANRKIFLYPENYLDPSIRQSKTQLFKELEDSLQQGVLDKENIEKAFLTYLDGFTELGKLVYVDAYYHGESSDSAGSHDTIYFFARTSSEPYKYYYLTWQAGKQGDIWSEWEKIKIPINATHITPIYSFGRLFLFWVEKRTIKDSNESSNINDSSHIIAEQDSEPDSSGSKKVQVENATIKYSFYNFNKDWVQPQTLTPERIIGVSGAVNPDSFGGLFPSEFFDMTQLTWNKVYCLNIPANTPGNSSKAEKLVVLLGPMLNTVEHQGWKDADLTSYAKNPYLHTLETWLLKAAKIFKTILTKEKGNLPVFPPTVLESDFEANFLVNQHESIFLPDADSKDNFFCFVTDGTRPGQLQDEQVINDNYNYSRPVGFTSVDEQFFPLPDELRGTTKPVYFHAVPVYDGNLGREILVLLASGNKTKDQQPATYFSRVLPESTTKKQQWTLISTVLAEDAFAYDFLGTGKATDLFLHNRSNALYDVGTVKKDNTFTRKAGGVKFDSPAAGDRLTPLDYNGTGKLENLLYYRPGPGTVWLYKKGLNGYIIDSAAGFPSADIRNPTDRIIAFDYKGDGLTNDLLYYRPAGEHYIGFINKQKDGLYSLDHVNQGDFFGYNFGDLRDRVMAFDFLSSGKQDHLLIYRPGTGKVWIFKKNKDGTCSPVYKSEIGIAGHVLKEDDRFIAYDHDDSGKKDHLVIYNSLNAGHIVILHNSIFNKQSVVEWLSSPVPAIPRGSQTLAVANHPAAFVYRGDKESFLMLDRAIADPTISAQISLKAGEHGITNLSVKAAKPNPDPKSYTFEATRLTTAAVHRLSSTLFLDGLDALMSLSSQKAPQDSSILPFKRFNFISTRVTAPKNLDGAAVDFHGTYGQYYWELFFHAPHLVFSVLNGKQMFDLAENWMKYIFDPTASLAEGAYPNSKYWQFLPFRNHPPDNLKDQLSNSHAINAYHDHPFDPHAIARLRVGAYEKATVMQFIDNLLDWGDQLFQQYSWESITTATMYYNYAWNLLGPKPQSLGPCKTEKPVSYQDISDKYGAEIPEFLISLENALPANMPNLPSVPFNALSTYFCIPENENFIAYWDRVADRLFKIRHCLNIDGKRVPLPLFQPPIDPMSLARAAGLGRDVLSIYSDTSSIGNYHRFHVLLDRARSFTASVMQFGTALQTALEKKDAADLTALRLNQEKAILNLTTQAYRQRIVEQQYVIDIAEQNKEIALGKEQRFKRLIDGGWNAGENGSLANLGIALIPTIIAGGIFDVAMFAHEIPTIYGFADGGVFPGKAIEDAAKSLEGVAKLFELNAEIAAQTGELYRRDEEWEFERMEAEETVKRIELEILAAETQLTIIQNELQTHEKSIEQVDEYELFLKNKFTNKDLYQWMVSRISTVYNQAYHVALDMSIKAQAAYNFELSKTDNFVQFDYWDSIHRGLLAGQGLLLSLNQMESAYLNNDVPRMQLEKEVSLLHLDPVKFMAFKIGEEKGTLDFSFTQQLFDCDFPGHYDRKIKAISLKFIGTGLEGNSINATLTQHTNTVYIDKSKKKDTDGNNVRENWLKGQSVALSGRKEDAGLFVLDFRFPDDQYFPFEGTGAISTWNLEVPQANNQIRLADISDIVVKVYYTSLSGGTPNPSSNTCYSSPIFKAIDLKSALGKDKWKAFASTPVDGNFVAELPLADGKLITDIADIDLVSAWVALDNTLSVSDNDTGSFASLAVGGGSFVSVPIKNNKGQIQLSKNATEDKINLRFDTTKVPAGLIGDNKQLKTDVLSNVFLIVAFKSKGL